MNEDKAYAGILMKDGTELSHYGVKGMKWGKKLFGKVKGVFGKPSRPTEVERYGMIANNYIRQNALNAMYVKKHDNKIKNAEKQRMLSKNSETKKKKKQQAELAKNVKYWSVGRHN